MLANLIRSFLTRTPRKVVIEVERTLRASGGEGFSVVSFADVLAADRESH